MRAGYTRICSYAAQALLASQLLLGTLSGCSGHDAPHARTDSTTDRSVSAALPAAHPQTTTPVETVQSHPTSLSTAERTALPVDSTALKRAQRTTKSDSTPERTTISPSSSGNTQAAETGQGNTKGETVTGEQSACAEITPEMVKQGRTVFVGKGNCTTCHGAEGKGNQLGPDLTDNKWLHISGDYPSIVGIVRKGINLVIEHPTPMPAMGGSKLTDEEVCAVSAYVWSLTH